MPDFAQLPPDPDDPPLWVRLVILACLILFALAFATVGGCQPCDGRVPMGAPAISRGLY